MWSRWNNALVILVSRPPRYRGTRRWRTLLAVALTGGVFAVGWWAGRAALEPPQDPIAETTTLTYTVTEGEVSREIPLSIGAGWAATASVISASGGVVTSVDAATGAALVEGASLLTVNLRPIVVAQGSVPVFRALSTGLVGPDVAQLQGFLDRIGLSPGPSGRFDAGTASAVRAWQRTLGLTATGTVELGDLVFSPALPVRLRVSATVGVTVGPGTVLAEALAPAPTFTASVTTDQFELIPPEAAISVDGRGELWSAFVGSIDTSDPNAIRLVLAGLDGGPVCGASCDRVPVSGASVWSGSATVIPPASGPLIPVSAITTQPDGSTTVRSSDSADVPVTVLASNGGLAVVEGLSVGDEIEVPMANND